MRSSGFKSLGDQGWVGYWSNIFWDRDVQSDAPKGERFTLPALKEYADWANSKSDHLPTLWFWHLPNVELGQAKTVNTVGPFIFAKGEWSDNPMAARAKAYFADPQDDIEWGMSHGFRFDPGDRIDGEYHKFRTYEVSVLPVEAAANPVTMFQEAEYMNVKDMIASLVKIGIPENEAAEIVGEAKEQTKAMQADGQSHGQKDGEEPAAEPTTEAAAESEEAGEVEPVEADETAELAADLLIKLTERDEEAKALRAELDALKAAQVESTKAVTELVDLVKELRTEREAEKALLPRAVQQALLAKVGEKVAGDDVKADMKKQHAELSKETGGKVDYDADPIGWMASMSGIPGLS